ncbi:MAG: ribosomal protein S18-alanine N-acetyltransferase [Actinomycetota bacterium]|nr:ribosomal protein S18-alanine N-acetyltransferase [Actinomycetota bacterium]MDA2971929.1 ribosomal protein S18-alanine N-acetyltransferase [Actinomycetota bacterium]MDA3001679.1 ribosomal protein S18-alanine N-acetyltransferase [Actinomycetota bacterium]
MSLDLTIEPMRRRHVKNVLNIENVVHPKPWSSGVFSSELDLARRGERYYVVAFLMGELVGYAGSMYAVDEAHVTNIAVAPEFRRRGVARSLLHALARAAIDRNMASLTLEVRVGNEAAQGLYREFGFAPAGIRQRYYENSEDALVMWIHDIQGDEFAHRLDRIGSSHGSRA